MMDTSRGGGMNGCVIKFINKKIIIINLDTQIFIDYLLNEKEN